MIFYVDRLKTKPVRGKPGQEKVERVIRERLVEVRMVPATWKIMSNWMKNRIGKVGRQFGKIPEGPKSETAEAVPYG